MVLKVAVAEDNHSFRKELVEQITSEPGFEVCYATDNGQDLLTVLEREKPEIVILDIHMPGLSGLETARIIRRQLPYVEIIFITAFAEYIKDAVKLYVSDYIVKPLDGARFNQTLSRIYSKLVEQQKLVRLKMGDGLKIIGQNEIYFAEAFRKNTIIYTAHERLTTSHLISKIEKMLDPELFFKTGRSYLINLTKVESVKLVSRTSYRITFRDIKGEAYLAKAIYPLFRDKIKAITAKGPRTHGSE